MNKLSMTIAFVFLTLLSLPVMANDSSSAIGIGGLELTRNDDVSMDSEELYISRKQVRVKYQFTNVSARDVDMLVSFPLPAIPGGIDGHLGDRSFPVWKDFKFETRVNGIPVTLNAVEQIEANGRAGKDVSARLKQLGWPARYWNKWGSDSAARSALRKKFESYSASEIDAFVAEGLLRVEGRSKIIGPNWSLVTYVTRKQKFPAGKTVIVEHSYEPIAGGSLGGGIERQYRAESKAYLNSFCVDKSFLAGFDKRRYGSKKDKNGNETGGFYVEHWVDYVLSSGANWKGPIKDFRLVIDKEKPTNLVSFCMDGVKKISPTQFEVRKKNFEPQKDLKILIVEWFNPNA